MHNRKYSSKYTDCTLDNNLFNWQLSSIDNNMMKRNKTTMNHSFLPQYAFYINPWNGISCYSISWCI